LEQEGELIQLAGHLCGKAQREWELMVQSSKTSFAVATETLQARLDSLSQVIAERDLLHLIRDSL